MRKIKLGKHVLEIYDSIDELPIVRHHKFTKLMLIDAQIGATLADFDSHIERIVGYIKTDKKELAEKEIMNLRQNVYFMQNEVSPRLLSFATLVKKLDGKECSDLSVEALGKIANILSDVPSGAFASQLEESKKKLESELQLYFPDLFNSSTVKEYFDKLKQRTELLLDRVLGKISADGERLLEKITMELVLFSDPSVFSGPGSLEIQQDKQFENACLVIAQHTNTNPKRFTTLEYYNALFFIKDQTKIQSKKPKNGR